jgi:hypothetical protein
VDDLDKELNLPRKIWMRYLHIQDWFSPTPEPYSTCTIKYNAPSATRYKIFNPPKDLHIKTIKRHPRRPIRLTQISPRRQRFRPIESTDIVQTKEPALEDIVAALIFPVDPPGEVEQQFLEHPFQKGQV